MVGALWLSQVATTTPKCLYGGLVSDHCKNKDWMIKQIEAIKFTVRIVRSKSDDEGACSKRRRVEDKEQELFKFSRADAGLLHAATVHFGEAHLNLLANKQNFYRNDAIKIFIISLIKLALFDVTSDYRIAPNFRSIKFS